MVVSCNRWLAVRLDLLCGVFVITVAVTAVLIGENSGKYSVCYSCRRFVTEIVCLIFLQFGGQFSVNSRLKRFKKLTSKLTYGVRVR